MAVKSVRLLAVSLLRGTRSVLVFGPTGLIPCSDGKRRERSGSRTVLIAAGLARRGLSIERAIMRRREATRGRERSVARRLKRGRAHNG